MDHQEDIRKDEDDDDLFGDDDDDVEEKEEVIESSSSAPPAQARKSLLEGDDNDDDDLFGESDDKELESGHAKEKGDLDDLFGAEEAQGDVKINRKNKSNRTLGLLPKKNISPSANNVILRTPNFLKFQMQQYDSASHDPEEEKSLFGDAIAALVRWRPKVDESGTVVCDPDGKAVLESNARLIQWSDGTYQLVVGELVFDARLNASENGFVYHQQKSLAHPEIPRPADEVKEEMCLECAGAVHNRMVLKPVSLKSDVHARISVKISNKHATTKKVQVREIETIMDHPDLEHDKWIRQEEEKMKKEKKLRDNDGGYSYAKSRPSMSHSYLEGGDDEDAVNLSSIKRKSRDGGSHQFKRLPAPKRPKKSYDDGEIPSEDEEEDDGEDLEDFIDNEGAEEDDGDEEEDVDYEDDDDDDEDEEEDDEEDDEDDEEEDNEEEDEEDDEEDDAEESKKKRRDKKDKKKKKRKEKESDDKAARKKSKKNKKAAASDDDDEEADNDKGDDSGKNMAVENEVFVKPKRKVIESDDEES